MRVSVICVKRIRGNQGLDVQVLVISVPRKNHYTRTLTPVDFSDAVFACEHLKKIAEISSIWDVHYIL